MKEKSKQPLHALQLIILKVNYRYQMNRNNVFFLKMNIQIVYQDFSYKILPLQIKISSRIFFNNNTNF